MEKILLVDDDQFVLECFHRMLSSRFEIETACGAEEALGVISSRGPFAVMVSDFRMPGINGIQLIEKVKGTSPAMLGILLTGNAESANPGVLNNAAIFRVLDKPCPHTTLIAVLNDALNHYRLQLPS